MSNVMHNNNRKYCAMIHWKKKPKNKYIWEIYLFHWNKYLFKYGWNKILFLVNKLFFLKLMRYTQIYISVKYVLFHRNIS